MSLLALKVYAILLVVANTLVILLATIKYLLNKEVSDEIGT